MRGCGRVGGWEESSVLSAFYGMPQTESSMIGKTVPCQTCQQAVSFQRSCYSGHTNRHALSRLELTGALKNQSLVAGLYRLRAVSLLLENPWGRTQNK